MPDAALIHADDISDEDARALSDKFLLRIQDEDMRECVHECDVRRAKVDLRWSRRFLAHCDHDQNKALDFMIESVKFRHSMNVNDLTYGDVRREFFDIGAVHSHGRDCVGCRLFVFNSRLHYKQSGDMYELGRQFLAYWIEKIEREERGSRITIVFDMAQAGFANIDIGFIQYLINLFKLYYPDMLQSILVFEMPMLFTATWGMVKNMLPAKSHQLIRFVSKKDMCQMVPEWCCLTRWGGSDTWSYDPAVEDLHMPPSPFLTDNPPHRDVRRSPHPSDGGDRHTVNGALASAATGDHVTPVDPAVEATEEVNGHDLKGSGHARINGHSSSRHAVKVQFSADTSSSGSDVTSVRSLCNTANVKLLLSGSLEVSPAEEIVFQSGVSEAKCPLILTNHGSSPIAFKVKTTSRDKFRVRPSGGVVLARCHQLVHIALCDGVTAAAASADRFLLLAASTDTTSGAIYTSSSELEALWQKIPAASREEIRFRCVAMTSPTAQPPLVQPSTNQHSQLSDVTQRLDDVTRQMSDVTSRLAAIQRLHLFIVWSLVVLVLLQCVAMLLS